MSSDDLRLILIFIGATIVLAIYLSGRFRRRNDKFPEEASFEEEVPLSFHSDPPNTEQIPTGFNAKRESGALPPTLESKVDIQKLESKAVTNNDSAPNERIVMLHVQFTCQGGISGGELLQSLYAMKLEVGDMDIFHLYDDSTRTPVFSVANMVNPGTLRPSDLPTMKVPGITLFARLPGPLAPLETFEKILTAAQTFASRLRGKLTNESHLPMTENEIGKIRSEMTDLSTKS